MVRRSTTATKRSPCARRAGSRRPTEHVCQRHRELRSPGLLDRCEQRRRHLALDPLDDAVDGALDAADLNGLAGALELQLVRWSSPTRRLRSLRRRATAVERGPRDQPSWVEWRTSASRQAIQSSPDRRPPRSRRCRRTHVGADRRQLGAGVGSRPAAPPPARPPRGRRAPERRRPTTATNRSAAAAASTSASRTRRPAAPRADRAGTSSRQPPQRVGARSMVANARPSGSTTTRIGSRINRYSLRIDRAMWSHGTPVRSSPRRAAPAPRGRRPPPA